MTNIRNYHSKPIASDKITKPSPEKVLRQKFDRARLFIEQQRYEDAKTLLRTIDHDKARLWITKINNIQRKQNQRLWNIRGLIMGIAVAIILFTIIMALKHQADAQRAETRREIEIICPACRDDN